MESNFFKLKLNEKHLQNKPYRLAKFFVKLQVYATFLPSEKITCTLTPNPTIHISTMSVLRKWSQKNK